MDDSCGTTIGFIGLGLIGGSIALSLRAKHPEYHFTAYQYKKEPDEDLEKALADKTLDSVCTDLSDGFSLCDIIFLCAPILSNLAYLKELRTVIKPSCIITDTGSVKGNIHAAAAGLGLEQNFIGGHPMAGSEKTGYRHASGRLLENAFYILSSAAHTPAFRKETMEQCVLDTGAIPLWLDAAEHDDIAAAISHIPHILAAALVNLVRDADNGTEQMRRLAAGGFRDITRIASSSPVMWQNICLSNKESICRFLALLCSSLEQMEQALKREDAFYLYQVFEEAAQYRDSIPERSAGMISKVFELYMDIADETGAIAAIAALLAQNSISIKNIGIIHNREFQDGVLRMEFYARSAVLKAGRLLESHGYLIY